jgi:hypothetical protein
MAAADRVHVGMLTNCELRHDGRTGTLPQSSNAACSYVTYNGKESSLS